MCAAQCAVVRQGVAQCAVVVGRGACVVPRVPRDALPRGVVGTPCVWVPRLWCGPSPVVACRGLCLWVGVACGGGVCGAALPWWRGGWGFVGSDERSFRPAFLWLVGGIVVVPVGGYGAVPLRR